VILGGAARITIARGDPAWAPRDRSNGGANPTLIAIALTLRLADHLKRPKSFMRVHKGWRGEARDVDNPCLDMRRRGLGSGAQAFCHPIFVDFSGLLDCSLCYRMHGQEETRAVV
jgi:hypothetical protein